jgi:hypothetical protein
MRLSGAYQDGIKQLERQKEPKNASADALYYLLEYYYFVL